MKKLLSITLSIIMLISAVFFIAPTPARAETLAQNTPTMRALRADELSPYVDATTALSHGHVARVPAEEDLNTIVYRNLDGTKTAYFFDYNVKYVDENGATKDKDITLATKAGGFGLTQSDISLTIPTDITNGVEFTHNGNYIKLTPLRETIIEESLSSSAAALNKPQSAVKDTTKNEISYQKAFGNNTSLRYVPTMEGIKEEIILSSYTGTTAWRFLATTNGLTPYKDASGIYYFATAEDSDERYSLGEVYTYDSVGNYTYGTMTVTEVKPAQQYIITLNVDEEFLTADSTVYPVYVDPTLKIVSDNSSNVPISDATMFQGNANTPTGSNNRLFIGKMATSGIGRAVMRFDTLINNPVFYTYMDTIVEATLSLYVFQVKSGGDTITLHRFNNTSWSENSITWANGSPNSYGSTYYTVPVNDEGTLNINITGMVQSWKAVENYLRGGILFKVADESSSTFPVQIESSENSLYAHQPVLTIKYTTDLSEHFETDVVIHEDETAYLMTSALYEDTAITYFSNDLSIATVNSNGIVMGVGVGTTTIRVTVDIYGYPQDVYCSVKVKENWKLISSPTIKPRSEWGARPIVSERLEARSRVPERIIFHHTADKFNSTDINDVINEIKRIQNDHIDQEDKCDIAYHYIIDPAGRIWQGAEVDDYRRGHATGHFEDIGVVILGDFEPRLANLWKPNELNQNQKNAIVHLTKWLCYEYDLEVIESGVNIAPVSMHKIVETGDQGTVCPGANVASYIEEELIPIIEQWRS